MHAGPTRRRITPRLFEAIRCDQRDADQATSEDDVVENSLGVSIGAAAQAAPGPEARRHFDDRKQPDGSTLAGDEGEELIGLKLKDWEVFQHLLVESLRRDRRALEPPRDCVAGVTCDPGCRRKAHAFDSQAGHLVERPPAAAKTAVRRPGVRAKRCAAAPAPISPTPPRLRCKPAVAHDVDARLSKVVAPGLAARDIGDRPHRSSVPGRETCASPRSQALEGDRSTVMDASTKIRNAATVL